GCLAQPIAGGRSFRRVDRQRTRPWILWWLPLGCARLMATLGDSPAGVCRVESTISSLICAAESGDGAAANTLFSTLYSELHRMAKRELARKGSPANLGATTLLHEAYLDIAAREGKRFPDRPRFMGYAARAMRGLIIDHARRQYAVKRGGEFE